MNNVNEWDFTEDPDLPPYYNKLSVERKQITHDLIRERCNDVDHADDFFLFDVMDGLPMDDMEDVVSDPYQEFFSSE